MTTPVAAVEGLRDRRRRETSIEICAAALDLFEQKGVHGTTVDEIAARAGVSPRTFFRLAGTKEDAVFVDDGRFAAALAEVGEPCDDIAALLAVLRGEFARELALLDADARARERFLRVRRLIAHESALLGAAVRREVTSADRFVPGIAQRTGLAELDVRAALSAAGLEMRMTLDEWARCYDDGETSSLVDLHREVQARFAAALRP
ncbi:TetR/AcrR family transcriptional regulator [Microbacterium trichothecenolyticum]|uniref:AcrR family transcriptional regulator n=1 Tax=Microbacterium trichothecenolyticum TaxID=69370 RepID=A0ABU0TXE1_MICTR|nr:TetR/AcrR family transcriptional regulator [Microbacterium trichothecenolyticum]MDQ1124333.1 AcrR family transcriptional regulator [Microbacterium trichothecenolyticum]